MATAAANKKISKVGSTVILRCDLDSKLIVGTINFYRSDFYQRRRPFAAATAATALIFFAKSRLYASIFFSKVSSICMVRS